MKKAFLYISAYLITVPLLHASENDSLRDDFSGELSIVENTFFRLEQKEAALLKKAQQLEKDFSNSTNYKGTKKRIKLVGQLTGLRETYEEKWEKPHKNIPGTSELYRGIIKNSEAMDGELNVLLQELQKVVPSNPGAEAITWQQQFERIDLLKNFNKDSKTKCSFLERQITTELKRIKALSKIIQLQAFGATQDACLLEGLCKKVSLDDASSSSSDDEEFEKILDNKHANDSELTDSENA